MIVQRRGEGQCGTFVMVFSRVLRDSTPRFVCPTVGRSVTLYFFYDFYFFTSLLLPKWSSDLKYGPVPTRTRLG